MSCSIRAHPRRRREVSRPMAIRSDAGAAGSRPSRRRPARQTSAGLLAHLRPPPGLVQQCKLARIQLTTAL
eukprot:6070657-Pleurochrysis_carterae.AAC.4